MIGDRLLRMLMAAALGLLAASLARPAAAHPMGNFSINHYAAIAVAADRIEVRYLIDMAEIPTFQEMHQANFAADPADPHLAPYLTRKLAQLRGGLILELNHRPLQLRELSHDVTFTPGAGGLPTMRLGMRLAANVRLSAGGASVDYRDENFPGRAGWKEVIAGGVNGVSLASASVPSRDRSAGLSNYPIDPLNSPPQTVAAHVQPLLGGGPALNRGGRPRESASLPPRRNRAYTPRSAFTQLMTVRQPGMWFLLTAALIAVALGALHALEPGHGKTVVAAYLVGSRGTARHALMLAATVTASHTAGVYVLGALTLYASRWIIPDRIYPWLAGLSGLIIAALGMGIFVRRIRNRRAEPSCRRPHTHTHGRSGSGHAHEHPHEHFHDHRHLDSHRHDIFGRHIHDAEAASGGARSISTRGLLALGISGGIVPCPAALVVLLSALSFNRAAFGLFLIVAFSAGLAAVLIGFGLAVVYARRLLIDRIDPQGGLVVRWLPIISSAVITVAGCAITLQALANGGVINLGR